MSLVLGSLLAAASSITVTGNVPSEPAAQRFVAQVAIAAANDVPLARFTDPVCVGSTGLPPSADAVVADRITAVAASAGLRIARPGCTPNVMVVFVKDGRDAVRTLSQAGSGAMLSQSHADIRRLLAEPGPVWAWSEVDLRSRDGDPQRHTDTGPKMLHVPTSTRLSMPIHRDIVSSVVLINRDAAADRDLRQIADYAALRALTGAKLKGSAKEPTILTLFTPEAGAAGDGLAPNSLTAADRTFLSAFYAVRADMAQPLQRQRMVDQMARSPAAP
ncbi:hypothetical protein EDF56_10825 [Novosphingobium sp. PhB165]|uniref:hypothetical protein n=1 Tax=Novosphingobium sp. PhB165 TaxID=2485105 RepID=UPI00104A67F6|nr:hypothetical protein [Novosphingobium sp. PhB165]TCM16037.1 hypothetical protein EDF56_10825 [Novosphingobium sp. PhB165]